MATTHIKTTSGFECDIDEDTLDDIELIEDLVEIDSGNATLVPRVIGRLLPDDKKKLYDHVRTDKGRVPIGAVGEELAEIIKGLNSKKK